MAGVSSRPGSRGRAGLAALLLLALPGAAAGDVPLEKTGRVETLAEPSRHWLFVTDILVEKASLVDLAPGGGLLGMINTGYGPTQPLFAPGGREFYVPETFYARKTRGSRTDVVTVYDLPTLSPVAEIPIPPKRALNQLTSANAALSDDGRFLAVFNFTPATSLSIVDVKRRRFVGEIATPGCSLAYAAGPRRFFQLCMDGAALVVSLDDQGREASKVRTARFFDPVEDPVTEKAVRRGDEWLFVSFEGEIHPVDVSGAELRFGEAWSLHGEGGRGGWRVGGAQHLAVHDATGRLYALVHEGGPDTHKQAGTQVWVYDLASRQPVERIRLRSPGPTVMGESLEFGSDWIWPFNHLYDGLLRVAPLPGVDSIEVTQGDEPLLATASTTFGSVGVHDATSGRLLRRVLSGNLTSHALEAPFGPTEAGP